MSMVKSIKQKNTPQSSLKKSILPRISTENTISFFRDALKTREAYINEMEQFIKEGPSIIDGDLIITHPSFERSTALVIHLKSALFEIGASHQLAWSLARKFFGWEEMMICPSEKKQLSSPEKSAQAEGKS